MKITMYELLGLIKEGKAPKKIKYEYFIYELTPEKNDYYCKNEMRWFTDEINSLGVLNDYVEIIEEPKKIEKINRNRYHGTDIDPLDDILDKLDELTDEINNLKENRL